MSTSDPWSFIHGERKALLDDLQGLPEAEWDTPSLCAGWTVRQVIGHMAATAKMTPPKFLGHIVSAGFWFNAMVNKDLAKETEGTSAELLGRFAEQMTATTHPPGPVDATVGESVVHPEDIRRPLGIAYTYPAEMLIRAADFYKESNLLIGGGLRRRDR